MKNKLKNTYCMHHCMLKPVSHLENTKHYQVDKLYLQQRLLVILISSMATSPSDPPTVASISAFT